MGPSIWDLEKVMFFFDTCNAVAACIKEFDVVTSQRQTQSASDCVMLLESIT